MGAVQQGQQRHAAEINPSGAFIRTNSKFLGAQKPEVISEIPLKTNRYYIIASKSCPWSHRVTITRALKGLEEVLPLHFAAGPRVEGYALSGGDLWPVPGGEQEIRHLHQLYSLSDINYTGRATIPVLWDSWDQKIISNESSDIARALDSVQGDQSFLDFTLVPEMLRADIDQANAMIYEGLNNAVYQAGFAQSQLAYEAAIDLVFHTLDEIEKRLAKSRYYFGDTMSETDWRLFPTLCRFDAIYYILFKCCKRRLVDYPALWAYAKDLFQTKGVAGSVDFDAMRVASYQNDSSSENPLVAIQPDSDWHAPHGRKKMGESHVFLRDGEKMAIDPKNFQPIESRIR